jgi:hypothetical protein
VVISLEAAVYISDVLTVQYLHCHKHIPHTHLRLLINGLNAFNLS